MAKENNKKLIIWALVALVVGVAIGLLLTSLVATGNAKYAIQEARLRNTSLETYPNLMLTQWIDNRDESNSEIKYDFDQYEYASSTIPATLNKSFGVRFSDGTTVRSSNLVSLTSEDGQYTSYGHTYSEIPFNQNNLTISASLSGRFNFADGQYDRKSTEIELNPNGDAFAEVTAFDFSCNGQYQMIHTDVGGDQIVYYYLYIYEPNGGESFDYRWSTIPMRNYNYSGYFPQEATAILASGLDYLVYLRTNIVTTTGLTTEAETAKDLNCQSGKSGSLTSEQIKTIEQELGNSPEARSEEWMGANHIKK